MKSSWIYIIALLIIIASATVSYSEDEQTVVNWSYPHYENDQLLWEAKGKTAVIGENEISVLAIEIIYHLQPASTTAPAEPTKKSTIRIKANMGTIDNKQRMVSLHENIVIRKVSEPPDEFDETMKTNLLSVDLTEKTFSTDSLITINRSDTSIKSKGCKGGLDFVNISFLSNVEMVVQGCDSKSISLGLVFSRKPETDNEELSKNPSVITVTSDGPMNIEKINGNPAKKVAQRISFQNKVALNSFGRQPNSPPRITNLHSDNLNLLLDRRENPVTKRNNFYLSHISATGSVTVDDSFHRAECSTLTLDDAAGLITLKGTNKSLAAITRPLKPNNGQSQTKADSYINIAALTLKIQTEKDNLLLLGRKEIVFSNGSIYNPAPVSPTDTISPTDTTPPMNQPPDLSTQIKITADNDGLVSLRENRIYLENKVRITQWTTTITDSTKPKLKATIKCDKLFIGWDSAKNLLERLKADGNVYISSDGSEAWGEIMEWTPLLSQINIKSPRKVKILHKNSSIDGDEIVITTNPQDAIDNWTNIEIKNKTNGSIRIAPKEKEEPKEEEKPK
jgi:lipopolysaccharide export system protein LptC